MEQNTENLLRELANKFGTTTEKLYGVLVKQAKVEIVKSLVFLFSFGLVLLLGLHFLNMVNWVDYKQVSMPDGDFAFIAVYFINILLWIIAIFSFSDSIGSIIENAVNPEYFAISEIISAISNKED